jgi:3-deoxy-manno-octulosonate cytidylyltransferase (CMP-KDO synthetase)
MTLTEPQVLAVIPARYASTRFPGKPLVSIHGKPMIQHVWERAQEAPGIHKVVIATDDERIYATVSSFGGTACMTSPHHPSGTDRVWEVAKTLPQYDLIFNVQGDEPFIDPASLQGAIAAIMENTEADIVTLVTPIRTQKEWEDPNIVKAVLNRQGKALYFSRAPLPSPREAKELPTPAYRHLGLYLYRRKALERFTALPPSPLEQVEKLEQLRALEDGMTLYTVVVDKAPIGIDTPEDLQRIEDLNALKCP